MLDRLKRAAIGPENALAEITLGDETIPIVLRRHPTARRLTLRLAPDGSEVRITLPRWAYANEAIAFAHARTDWLADQHARIPRRAPPGPGGKLSFRGKIVTIDWDERHARRPMLGGDSVQIGGQLAGLETRLRRWLEREALTVFEDDARFYCEKAGLAPAPVGISRAQKRWGSCSDKERIRINWRLIQAPDFVRRSVVAHEVAHLVHFDHSPAFHQLLGDIFEGEIASADAWLKKQGRSLYASFG